MVTSDSCVQPLNAYLPMLLSEPGSTTAPNCIHPLKAYPPILVSVLGKLTLASEVQLENVPEGMEVK